MPLVLAGATSGQATIQATDAATVTLTLPATSGTIAISGSSTSFTNLAYTGTLTGGTGVVNLGSGQFYKDASGNVGIGTSSPAAVTGFSTGRTVLQVTSGSSAQVRIGSGSGTMIDHDDSGNTITTIRSLYGATSASAQMQLQSGFITFGTGTSFTERMRIGSDGKVAIGTTTTSDGRLTVKQATDSYSDCFNLVSDTASGSVAWQLLSDGGSQRLFFARGGGRGYIDGTTGAYVPVSDSRVKKNVVDLNYGLSEILKLRPVKYNINIEEDTAKTHIGLIAQEVKSVIDEAVDDLRNTEDMYGLDKSGLVPVLIKAIQELKATVDAQAARIASLEGAK
jgi:hypothetical protein